MSLISKAFAPDSIFGRDTQVNELLMGCYCISMTEINSSLITLDIEIVEFLESQREIENKPSVCRPGHLSKKQMIGVKPGVKNDLG